MDLLCFSHIRWDFVYQRPQHLLSKFTKAYRVFYFEEPRFTDKEDGYSIRSGKENVLVVTPKLNHAVAPEKINEHLKIVLDGLCAESHVNPHIVWYYTPMALPFSKHIKTDLVVYDCMDELSAFKFAPPILKELEKQLLDKADIVFTGGVSLYNHKKDSHANIHPFPSSIDKLHFKKARTIVTEPADQLKIPHPRMGFYGVLDERLDIDLLRSLADYNPNWQIVMIGPIVKIDPESLPKNSNIHYLGNKSYNELPDYLSGWDVALILFALNESTKFISPTKTPEYLAAGKPVVSTPIHDVVHPYEDDGLVRIGRTNEEFIQHVEAELKVRSKVKWLAKTDAFLRDKSWTETWNQMVALLTKTFNNKKAAVTPGKKKEQYV